MSGPVPDRLLDRALTPRVARAVTSPSGMLLGGAGAAGGILAGLPVALAVLGGVVLWLVRVGVAIGRRPRTERIDPFALKEPWRRFVQEALQAQARYRHAVDGTSAGPLRDRLSEIGGRIDAGVQECWRIARRGQELEAAVGRLDVAAVRRQLADVERQLAEPSAAGSSLERTAEALRSQLSSAERLGRVAAEARDRLRLLDARLDEAVARATELSLSAAGTTELGGLDADVDGVVGDMEALRLALEEVGTPPEAGGHGRA